MVGAATQKGEMVDRMCSCGFHFKLCLSTAVCDQYSQVGPVTWTKCCVNEGVTCRITVITVCKAISLISVMFGIAVEYRGALLICEIGYNKWQCGVMPLCRLLKLFRKKNMYSNGLQSV